MTGTSSGTAESAALKTRADLKRELDATTPAGEEYAVLSSATKALEQVRTKLVSLRAERASIRRGISIRERKLRDWKGKIPRRQQVGEHGENLRDDDGGETNERAASRELSRLGDAPCHQVAHVCEGGVLQFRRECVRGLQGLRGFDLIWVLSARGNRVESVLARVLDLDERLGRLQIGAVKKEDENEVMEQGAVVVDIKPYLGYCEG